MTWGDGAHGPGGLDRRPRGCPPRARLTQAEGSATRSNTNARPRSPNRCQYKHSLAIRNLTFQRKVVVIAPEIARQRRSHCPMRDQRPQHGGGQRLIAVIAGREPVELGMSEPATAPAVALPSYRAALKP